jgi:hypothetical protein
MKTEEPMKRHVAVFGLCSVACSLGSLGCGSDTGTLFDEVALPAQGAPPDVPEPEMAAPNPDPEAMPVQPSTMSPNGEQPDPELPLSEGPMEGEVTPPDTVGEPPVMTDPPDPPEPSPILPTIVAVSPENGATAVESDAEIVVQFNVPMNRELTEAAYQSEGIPSSSVTFSWNDESTELTITPIDPLEYASGPDPDNVVARRLSFFISASAEDAQGNQLAAPEESSFSLLRQIDLTLFAMQNRDLTGNWRSNGTYGAAQCARNQTNVCVGDVRVNGQNEQYRGFITFDLSSLPESMARVSAAQLTLQITATSSNPFNSLGALFLEHARFDAIGPDAFEADALAGLGRIAMAGGAGTTLSANVLSALEVDVANRAGDGGVTQYRLRFEGFTDNDNNSDVILSAWNTHSLELSYLIP